uniref:Uncharacterized protein n=1 Tax=Rhizophora mucronata TaxID=61149 RepID=A0A2P2R1H7_RHIMU
MTVRNCTGLVATVKRSSYSQGNPFLSQVDRNAESKYGKPTIMWAMPL